MSLTTAEAQEIFHAEPDVIHAQVNLYYTAIMTTLLLYTYVLTFDSDRKNVYWSGNNAKRFPAFIRRISLPSSTGFHCGSLLCSKPTEAHHIWPRNSRTQSWITPNRDFCGFWWPRLIAGPVISVCTDLILILRVQALYARANWVLGILIPAYLCQLAIIVRSMWKDVAGTGIELDGSPVNILCIFAEEINTGSSSLAPVFIAAITGSNERFSCKKNMRKTLERWESILPVSDNPTNPSQIKATGFRAIFIVNLISLVTILVDPYSLYLGTSNVQMLAVITGVLVTRLLFNIKHATLKSRYNTSIGMSNLDFAIKSTNHSLTHNSGLIVHNEQIAKYSTAGKFGMTALRTIIDLDILDLGADIQSITDD
ncbi:hypothetical protein M422DRAFT_244746 [Sphaerobolus stellatus SS14]|nr:hypothetical protein M422DRAFT_244746 [Sphaerobolus stellatus SS14]